MPQLATLRHELTVEVSMRNLILAILASAVLGPFAATGADAMPIAPPVAPTSSVEQVGWVCNPSGRCWWQPNYYRRYGYYRRFRFDDDDWPRRRGYGGDGHDGWRRGWDDDNEQ
jgi:hypothetical protein